MTFHVPERARWADAPEGYASSAQDGNNGVFRLDSCEPGWTLAVIASDGEGWEHVSVHAWRARSRTIQQRTPTWAEMAQVKRLFWDDDDVTVQYYPRRADYVNVHPHTLHWWRPIGVLLPTPPTDLIGLRPGDRVQFHHHERVFTVTAINEHTGLVELDGMSGEFAPSLFLAVTP